jgi:hypothetical protein
MSEWEDLFQRLEILSPRRKKRVASEASIEAFETKRGIQLPSSYRRFSTTFGAGELCEFYRFSVPLNRKDEYDMEAFDHTSHGDPSDEVWEDYVPKDNFSHVLFFGSTIGGDLFAWRTDHVGKSDEGNEFKIYRFRSRPPAKLVATNFLEFFQACLHGKLDQFAEEPKQSYMRY